MTVRWGVAGPGAVADKVLRDLAHAPNAVLTAVGSRSAERAEAFAAVPAASAGRPEVALTWCHAVRRGCRRAASLRLAV